jgi:hypothetical protein
MVLELSTCSISPTLRLNKAVDRHQIAAKPRPCRADSQSAAIRRRTHPQFTHLGQALAEHGDSGEREMNQAAARLVCHTMAQESRILSRLKCAKLLLL